MTTAAIILAAGFSTRMGAPNKLLQEVGGQAIVRRVAEAVVAVSDSAPVVVLGHEAEQVRDTLAGLFVNDVVNPDPGRGQASSVRLGLETAPDADVTLIALGDQPFLTEHALRALLEAHQDGDPDKITVPMRGADRGNPIVLPRKLRATILAEGVNIGCGGFTRKNPHLTQRFETPLDAFFRDIDTPEDLASARADVSEGVR